MRSQIYLLPAAAMLLCAATALAEPDTFGLGTGRDGALTVNVPGTVINRYTRVTAPIAPGDTVLFVASAEGFAAGDLVMLLQTTGIVPEPARGDSGPIDLSNDPVGRWELARVSALRGQEMKLTAPLLYSYAGMVTQVIRVPEYTDVTVKAGGSLVAVPWDGSQGGVLAFLARGTIHNEGELQASGAGFRGGQAGQGPQEHIQCTSLIAADRLGAGRGEGISSLDFGPLAKGLENASNGGGGGLCPASGGGGGGNGAAGGRGGDSLSRGDWLRDVGGRGGAGLIYSMLDHLTLGGGGGQGYRTGGHSQGGAGGGGIFVRGHRLKGGGAIVADGVAGENATDGGAGGGGAGGSIYLRITDALECGLLSAQGGNGGSAAAGSSDDRGPSGGGGGGGRVLYEAGQSQTCPISVEAGLAGDWYLAGVAAGLGAGAQPDGSQRSAHQGTITKLTSHALEPEPCGTTNPVFRVPTNNAVVGTRTPTFEVEVTDTGVTGVKIKIGFEAFGRDATYDSNTRRWKYTIPAGSELTAETPYLITATQHCPSPTTTTQITIYADVTAPASTIVVKPPESSNSATAAFEFKTTNEWRVVNFRCQWDSQPEVNCGTSTANSLVSFTIPGSLSDGDHTFNVKGVDEAGNVGTAVSYSWTIHALPETTLTSWPPNPSNSPVATFEFSGERASGGFECSLDSAQYAVCTSPYTTPTLSQGEHTFSVRGKNTNGSVDDSPASHTWEVDTAAPDTQLTGTPPSPSNNPSAGFSFDATEEGSTFECKLDTGEYEACTSPWTPTTPLLDGSHTFSVRATDAATNVDGTPASYTWVVDTVAPDTQLTSTPPEPSNNPSAGFSFSTTEEGSTFECKLDTGEYEACISPWPPATPLLDGSHTFSVRARDAAGNVDGTPASYTWEVDTAAPDTQLTGTPPNPSNNPSAGFSFSATEAQSTFECKLDAGAYAACTSPWTPTTPLLDGSHTFSVKARDPAGNVDPTPASYPWGVDTVPPDTQLTGRPSNPSNDPSDGFTFSATEAGSTFECKLDAGAYEACTSPWTPATPLPDGNHTFSVRARDAATNVDGTPASYTWEVDTVAPDTQLTSTPSNPSNDPSAGFSFSATEEGGTFECKLDTAPYVDCTSPWTPATHLSDGSHTFSVRARDAATNVDGTPASYPWEVDTVVPDTLLTSTPSNPSNNPSAGFSFSATEEGSTFECKLDTAPYVDCTSPWTPATPLSDGSHTFSVRARDVAGNVDGTPASYPWEVDTVAPDTQLTSTPPNPSTSASAIFRFSATQVGSTFECKLDTAPYAPCNSPWPLSGLSEGSHTFSVKATDAAGNVDDTPASYPWEVDTVPPDTQLISTPSNPSNDPSAGFSFSATEVGSTFECKLDTAPYVDCTSPWDPSAPLDEGIHTFSVRARDVAGNLEPDPANHNWEVDTIRPDTVIESGPARITNLTTARFTFRVQTGDARYFKCAISWQDPQSPSPNPPPPQYTECDAGSKEYPGLIEGTYTFSVYAIDAANNTEDNPATYVWVVDLTPPETQINSVTGVGGGPLRSPTNSTSVTFRFSASEAGGGYSCSLDSPNGPFNECNLGSVAFPNLTHGAHTFSVKAVDGAGNADATPSTYDWVVDLVPPDTRVFNPWTNTDTKIWRTNDSSPTFMGRTERQSQVQIRIGDAAPDQLGSVGDSGEWELRTSQVLTDGTYTVRIVSAVDPAGNVWTPPAVNQEDPPPKEAYLFNFVVDLVAPDTEIKNKPPEKHNSTLVQFSLNAPTEPATLITTFECRLFSHRYNKEIVGTCGKAKDYDLAIDFGVEDVNGKYTFSALAKDEAGNQDPSPAVYNFEVFAETPASPEILSPIDGESVYDLTPTITGRTVPQGRVELFIGGVKAGLAQADDEGVFTFKFPEPLEPGTYELTSRVTDEIGNRSLLSEKKTVFTVFEPKPVAHAIGGGLGCATSGAEPWLALLGFAAGTLLSSRRRRR